MKLGIINGFDESSFAETKNRGLEFIEICRNYDNEAEAFINNVAAVKANIEKYQLPIQSVGRWNSSPNAAGKYNEQQMELNEALMEAAIEVGAPVFVCGCNYDNSVSLFKNYSFAVDYFGRMLQKADGRIKVAVYNCDWNNFVFSKPAWDVILGELPELGIKFDCSHAINRGEDYLAEISAYGERIYHFHVKGTAKVNLRGVDDPPAGMDGTCWGNVFATLYARGYNGGLSIEPHSNTWRAGSELGEKGIEFTIRFIKQFLL